MRVGIVCYEDPERWILGKFARRMVEHLEALEVDVRLLRAPDTSLDINHHLISMNYRPARSSAVDTLMITHIDTAGKLTTLQRQLEIAKLGVCVSRQTLRQLVQAGIPAERLAYVNPAHDEVMVPRKIRLGIFNKVHSDGRSRNWLLPALAEQVDLSAFSLTIMGTDWHSTVATLQARGVDVKYYDAFDRDEYIRLMPTMDYFVYMGLDEGSMAWIDALAAGVKTIATPQGFHLDAASGLTHPFTELPELVAVFQSILAERERSIGAVRDWTWRSYTESHVTIWRDLLEHGVVKTPLRKTPVATKGAAVPEPPVPILTEREYKKFLLKGTVRDLAFWIYEHRDPRTLSRRIVNKVARDAARYYRARQERRD